MARPTINLDFPLPIGITWQGKAELAFAVGSAHWNGLSGGWNEGDLGRISGESIAKTALQQQHVVIAKGFQIGLDGMGMGRASCCDDSSTKATRDQMPPHGVQQPKR
jgi:hypothetical protein